MLILHVMFTFTMMKTALYCLLLPLLARGFTLAPSTVARSAQHYDGLAMTSNEQDDDSTVSRRRKMLIGSLVGGAALIGGGAESALAVERAVGAYEKSCRDAGDCLERGDLDGAVGWNWGGRDRCDATDPKCGPNGVLLDEVPQGDAVPATTEKVTCLVAITVSVGREETGTLKFGLYGDATPQSVQQLVDFLSAKGLTTAARNFGALTEPVGLQVGGLVTGISPGQRIQFGIPSQAAAYARSMGLAKAGDTFEPMPRPEVELTSEKSVRPHDCAGLMSIPGGGLGYANNGAEDEAYANGKFC